jgi:hypothetical protein
MPALPSFNFFILAWQGNLKEENLALGETILNSILHGRNYSYANLKNEWEKIKSDPYDDNYGFLSPIFSFDKDNKFHSTRIFERIANFDENSEKSPTIGKQDIKKLSSLKKDNFVADREYYNISLDDFAEVYKTLPDENLNAIIQAPVSPRVYVYDGKVKKYLSSIESAQLMKEKLGKTIDKMVTSKSPASDKYKQILSTVKPGSLKLEIMPHGVSAVTEIGDANKIKFNLESEQNYDDKILMKTFLHELQHYADGDNLTSVTEEIEAEKAAMKDAKSILGVKNIFSKGKDETHLERFESLYRNSNYAFYSPGHGIPRNVGIVISAADVKTSLDPQNNNCVKMDTKVPPKSYVVCFGPDKNHPNNVKVTNTSNGQSCFSGQNTYNEKQRKFETDCE